MKRSLLTCLSLAGALLLSDGAEAQIKFGVAGPNASFGAQLTQGVGQAAAGGVSGAGAAGGLTEVGPSRSVERQSLWFANPSESPRPPSRRLCRRRRTASRWRRFGRFQPRGCGR